MKAKAKPKRAKSKALKAPRTKVPDPRKTPVDPDFAPAPHVTAPRPLGPPRTSSAITFAQSIESAYDLWQEHREHYRAARARLEDIRRKLDQEGEFVVGMVRAARGDSSEGLAAPNQLDAYHRDAVEKLEKARQALEHEAAESAKQWNETFAQVRKEVRTRVDRTLKLVKPLVRLRVRTLAGDQRILHVDRPGPDEAVLLCFVFTGKVPSRYGFLFDDMTDDPKAPRTTRYIEVDEAIAGSSMKDLTAALLATANDVLPLKGVLWLRVGSALVQLVERGPVMEAEVEDSGAFRNILTRDEAERIAGYLLKLRLDGVINLELVAE